MTPLTKDQVRKLAPEQQEALAEMAVRRFRSRQQLLKRARSGMTLTAGLFMGLAGGLAIVSTAIPRALPFAIIAVIALVTVHTVRLNKRLNALMELLEEDIKKAAESEQSDDNHA